LFGIFKLLIKVVILFFQYLNVKNFISNLFQKIIGYFLTRSV
jgi:hypothetical protein